MISGKTAIQRFVLLKTRNSILEINTTNVQNECVVQKLNGIKERACIKHASWAFNYFAVILFIINTKYYTAIISKDVISQEQFYALCLYLRSSNN